MYRPLPSCIHRDNWGGCRVHKHPWLLRWLGRPDCVFNTWIPPRDGKRTCAEQCEKPALLYCSFCGKSQHEIAKLFAGPGAWICEQCIELADDICRDEIKGYNERRPLVKSDPGSHLKRNDG